MGESEHEKQVRDEFAAAVNMSATELADWLQTDESRSVGQKVAGGHESTGHHSGRRIVQLLQTKQADQSDGDLAMMRKVSGYVSRHTAQRPDKPAAELVETPWRYSLMNWGHDPLK